MKSLAINMLLTLGVTIAVFGQEPNHQKEQLRAQGVKRVTSVAGGPTKRKTVSEFDRHANLLRRTVYGADEAQVSQEIFKYDDKDNVSESRLNGTKQTYAYKYDANDRLLEARQFDSDGKLQQRTEYLLNDNGQVTSSTSYAATGELKERRSYTYLNKNLPAQMLIQGPSGDIVSRITYEYSGDRLLRQSVYGPAGNLLRRHTYKHDQKGLVIGELQSNEKGEPLDRTTFEYEFHPSR